MKRKFNRNQKRITLWDIQLSSLTSFIQLILCGCKGDCSAIRYQCKNNLVCTAFCKCDGSLTARMIQLATMTLFYMVTILTIDRLIFKSFNILNLNLFFHNAPFFYPPPPQKKILFSGSETIVALWTIVKWTILIKDLLLRCCRDPGSPSDQWRVIDSWHTKSTEIKESSYYC